MSSTHDEQTRAIIDRLRAVFADRPKGTQGEVAAYLGLDKAQMSRLLKGARGISAAEAAAAADALGVSATWLVTGAEPTRPRPLAVAARLGDVTAAHAADAMASPVKRARALLEVRAQLEQIVRVPQPSTPEFAVPTTTFRKKAGIDCARTLRATLNLGDDPIADINTVIESHFMVDVAREPMPSTVAGLLIRDPDADALASVALMLINSDAPVGRQRFTAAHELCHLIFGDTGLWRADAFEPDPGDHNELRADYFAAEFLAPAAAVRAVASEVTDSFGAQPPAGPARWRWVASLVATVAARFGLTVAAAKTRCSILEIVDNDDRMWLDTKAPAAVLKLGGHEDKIDDIVPDTGVVDPPATLTATALAAYQAGMVGIGAMTALWGAGDADALERELAEAGWAPAFA